MSLAYGTDGQALTITLASNANTVIQASTVVDNSTNLFQNALVEVSIKTNAAGTSATGAVNVYAYGSADGGTTYNGLPTGTNGTLANTANLKLVAVIGAIANATTYNGIFSVASCFSGVMPKKWGIVVENLTGAALDSTAGNHFVKYQGITY